MYLSEVDTGRWLEVDDSEARIESGTVTEQDNNNKETMEFGRHEGKTFDEVPESYKRWMLGKLGEGGSTHQQSVKMCIHYLEELPQEDLREDLQRIY